MSTYEITTVSIIKNLGYIPAVRRDSGIERAALGDTVRSPVSRSMSAADIAEDLDKSEDVIRTTCNRRKDKFVKLIDGWGLKSNEI